MRFRQRLAAFFYGRNGVDALYYFNFALIIVLAVVRVFVRFVPVYYVLYGLEALLLAVLIFRFLSKNLVKRRRENQIFLSIWGKMLSWFKLTKNRIRDIKKYRYRTCKYCKATLRLPIRRGKNTVCCPKCKRRIDVTVLF